MAIEQLCVLLDSAAYDLIVVRHAADAPCARLPRGARMRIGRLPRPADRPLVRPAVLLGRLVGAPRHEPDRRLLLRAVSSQATGLGARARYRISSPAWAASSRTFQPRVERAYRVLRGAETAFVLVTGPEEQVLGDAEYLSTKMAELPHAAKAWCSNRVHREYRPPRRGTRRGEIGPEDAEQVARTVAAGARWRGTRSADLAANFVDYQALARGESLPARAVRVGLPRGSRWCRFRTSRATCTNLASLAEMHAHVLFGGKAAA